MRCLGILFVLVVAACVGCSHSRPEPYNAFEIVRGQEVLVTHFAKQRYAYLDGEYLIEKGREWVPAKNQEVVNFRRRLPVLVGNNGAGLIFGGGLADLAEKLSLETGAAAAIEPTPFIERTKERIRIAQEEGVPVFLLGFSAGVRDDVTALMSSPGRVRPFMVEPTYQSTIGYVKFPDKVEGKLTCFRIKGGSPLTFSGRDYEPGDFENPETRFENVSLKTGSHTSACDDPEVYNRLKTEILLLKGRPELPPLELAAWQQD